MLELKKLPQPTLCNLAQCFWSSSA